MSTSISIEVLGIKLATKLVGVYGFDGLLSLEKKPAQLDERLSKLAKIQDDLNEALTAVAELQDSAQTAKKEATTLEKEVLRLKEDKALAEELSKAPEEAFGRLFHRASAKGRGRGLIEGTVIGLITGCLSSWVVWYLTK